MPDQLDACVAQARSDAALAACVQASEVTNPVALARVRDAEAICAAVRAYYRTLKAERGKRAYNAGPQIKVVIIDLADYRANGLAVA